MGRTSLGPVQDRHTLMTHSETYDSPFRIQISSQPSCNLYEDEELLPSNIRSKTTHNMYLQEKSTVVKIENQWDSFPLPS